MSQIILKDGIKWFKEILSDEGAVFISSSVVLGNERVEKVIERAMFSPLSKGAKIINFKNILLLITTGSDNITNEKIGIITDYIQEQSLNTNISMTILEDKNLADDAIGITIIATGFESKNNF
jgi:cell division protein FtsZ